MIERFIEFIKSYNSRLQDAINESNIYDRINDVLTNLGSKEISKEEMDSFNAAILKLDLDENSRKRLPFILFLLKNNKKLDETQSAVLYEISKKIKKPDTSPMETLIEKNTKVIEKLSIDGPFEDVEDLIIVFNELTAAKGIRLTNEFKLGVLREIIERNHKYADKIETKDAVTVTDDAFVEDEEDEYKEKEVADEEKMSADEIREIMKKYNYSYDSLRDSHRAYLSKYATKERMIEVLEALKEMELYIKFNKDSNKYDFCKIVVVSTAKDIKDFVVLCNENGISAQLFVNDVPGVLVPNTVKHQKRVRKSLDENNTDYTSQGRLGNFKENIKYLSENGYDIAAINKKCKFALTINPYTLKYNLEMLANMYGITMKDGTAFTAITNGTAVERLDQIIESGPYGYEYAKTNKSKLCNITNIELFQIRLAEAANCSLFYYQGGTDLVKFQAGTKSVTDGKYKDDERLKLLLLPDTEIIKRFGRQVPTFMPEEEAPGVEAIVSSSEIKGIDVDNNSFIKFLDENYMENEYVYKINTTYISRKKVYRICQILKDNNTKITEDTIKYAISYNSILNQEDVENISAINFPKTFGGVN